MTRSRLTAVIVAVAGVMLGCSSSVGTDDLRDAVDRAGESTDACPLGLDVADAVDELGLDVGAVSFGEAEASVSERDEPAGDPLVAQRDDGLSVEEAAAGASVSCDFAIGDDELDVDLFVSRSTKVDAASAFVPAYADRADLDPEEAIEDLESLGGGEVVLAGDGATAVAEVETDGDGGAAILVGGGGVTGSDLEELAGELAKRVADS